MCGDNEVKVLEVYQVARDPCLEQKSGGRSFAMLANDGQASFFCPSELNFGLSVALEVRVSA